MRVTQSMLSNNMLNNLSRNYQNLGKYMNQLSTGKQINRPSDDPVIAMKGMNYRSQVTHVEQYSRNLGEVHNWLDNTDSALDKVQMTLERLRELAVQGANGTYEEGQRGNMASEVRQMADHIVDIANTKVNNKFIFNGTATTGRDGDPPYVVDADGNLVYPVNTEHVMIEVSEGTRINVNTPADSVFNADLFKDLIEFAETLEAGVDDEAIGEFIEKIDTHIDNNVNARADLGARQNRLELIENRILDQEIAAKDMMSKNEDADIEQVIMNLTQQEVVHRAALSSGARIIQPTLLDFLR